MSLLLIGLFCIHFVQSALIQNQNDLATAFNSNPIQECPEDHPFGTGSPMLCKHTEIHTNGRVSENMDFEAINLGTTCPTETGSSDFPHQLALTDHQLISLNASQCSYTGDLVVQMNTPPIAFFTAPLHLDLSGENMFSRVVIHGTNTTIGSCTIGAPMGTTQLCCGSTVSTVTCSPHMLCERNCTFVRPVTNEPDGTLACGSCCRASVDADEVDLPWESTRCCQTCFADSECVQCVERNGTVVGATPSDSSAVASAVDSGSVVAGSENVLPIVIGTAVVVLVVAVVLVVVAVCYVRVQMRELRAASQKYSVLASSSSGENASSVARMSEYGSAPKLDGQYAMAPVPDEHYGSPDSKLSF